MLEDIWLDYLAPNKFFGQTFDAVCSSKETNPDKKYQT